MEDLDFDEGVRRRLRQHVCGNDDQSINVLTLLGMVVTACALVAQAGTEPKHDH